MLSHGSGVGGRLWPLRWLQQTPQAPLIGPQCVRMGGLHIPVRRRRPTRPCWRLDCAGGRAVGRQGGLQGVQHTTARRLTELRTDTGKLPGQHLESIAQQRWRWRAATGPAQPAQTTPAIGHGIVTTEAATLTKAIGRFESSCKYPVASRGRAEAVHSGAQTAASGHLRVQPGRQHAGQGTGAAMAANQQFLGFAQGAQALQQTQLAVPNAVQLTNVAEKMSRNLRPRIEGPIGPGDHGTCRFRTVEPATPVDLGEGRTDAIMQAQPHTATLTRLYLLNQGHPPIR